MGKEGAGERNKSIGVTPSTAPQVLRRAKAGDVISFESSWFRDPLVLSGKSGSAEKPLVLRGPDATIGPGIPFEDFRETGNRLAKVQEAAGQFPGLYYLADNAALIVRNCQWVIIEDLEFEGCWPTAIYLDNCQNVIIRRVAFKGGTFAIGATGINTRHLLIEDCSWIQDMSGKGDEDLFSILREGRPHPGPPRFETTLWYKTLWTQVHGSVKDNNPPIDIKHDARAFDGDFFRAWTIAGYVVIRRNVIIDAFNAVHFFNEASFDTVESHSKNVLIENNWFVRIRDNAVEAEDFAWNWTVRHNFFVDCYVPFSVEMARSGHFYIYGNLGWNGHRPGPPDDDHSNGQLFKFPETHQASGPHYVFNNTWWTTMSTAKKKRFSDFHHYNNVIAMRSLDGSPLQDPPNVFGSAWQTPDIPDLGPADLVKSEEKRFTKRWEELVISFDGDCIEHANFPAAYREAGYPLGDRSHSSPVVFNKLEFGLPIALRLIQPARAMPIDLKLPDGAVVTVGNRKTVIGAWQGKNLISAPTVAFEELWPGISPFSTINSYGDVSSKANA